jgi:hypothetical protein
VAQSIIEYLREEAVKSVMKTTSFASSWFTWRPRILSTIGSVNSSTYSSREIIDLGDKLFDVFKSTRTSTRSNKAVTIAGNAWESLICWYLNLCLIGRDAVVIKHSKGLIPSPIHDALTVSYSNCVTNSESDLIAIVFPNKPNYRDDKLSITVNDKNGMAIRNLNRGKFNYKPVIDQLTDKDFDKFQVHVIQCKTNWNDNAQIPMLWDIIYNTKAFKKTNIKLGLNGYAIDNLADFTYSFVTVPTIRNLSELKKDTMCVMRVSCLSGGNYWGRPTKNGVAFSLKEMLSKNLKGNETKSHLMTVNNEINNINTTYKYFDI